MKKILLTFFTPILLYSQSLIFLNEFGNFQSANAFDVDLSYNIFVTDLKTNTISKINPSGKMELNIGGFGWNESTFDMPIDIVTNTLSLYVADKNNHRIQRFDKDLNFLSVLDGRNTNSDLDFGYPLCIEISNIGDLFILDSDNNRILKYNLSGEYLQEIGGNDAGNYAVANPQYFTLDRESNIYILDDEIIKVFDQYGNSKLSFIPEIKPNKINIYEDILILINSEEIMLFNVTERNIVAHFVDFPNLNSELIVDADISKTLIYVLTQHRLLTFRF